MKTNGRKEILRFLNSLFEDHRISHFGSFINVLIASAVFVIHVNRYHKEKNHSLSLRREPKWEVHNSFTQQESMQDGRIRVMYL